VRRARRIERERIMSDLTTQSLIEIREAIRETNTSLSGRIDQTNEHLDRVEKRQVATEVRLPPNSSDPHSLTQRKENGRAADRLPPEGKGPVLR
jgi:hypothetical protein